MYNSLYCIKNLAIIHFYPPLADSQNLYTFRFLITHWLYIRKNFYWVALGSRPRAPQSFGKNFFNQICGLLTTIVK